MQLLASPGGREPAATYSSWEIVLFKITFTKIASFNNREAQTELLASLFSKSWLNLSDFKIEDGTRTEREGQPSANVMIHDRHLGTGPG